jgi:hypothetical protein
VPYPSGQPVATGTRATNGLPTITFGDLDRFYAGQQAGGAYNTGGAIGRGSDALGGLDPAMPGGPPRLWGDPRLAGVARPVGPRTQPGPGPAPGQGPINLVGDQANQVGAQTTQVNGQKPPPGYQGAYTTGPNGEFMPLWSGGYQMPAPGGSPPPWMQGGYDMQGHYSPGMPAGAQSFGAPGDQPGASQPFPGYSPAGYPPGSGPPSGNPGNNQNTNTTQTGIDPRLAGIYNYATQQALARFSDPNGMQFYGGPTVAQFNPDDLAAQQALRQAAGAQAGTAQGGNQFLTAMLQRAVNPGADPTLNNAIDSTNAATMKAAFDPNGIFAQLRGGATEAGAVGGSRQGAMEGVAAGRLADTIANNTAQMQLQGRRDNVNAALGASGNIPNYENMAMAPASMLGAVGSQERAMTQGNYDDQLRRWAYNTYEPDRRLQNLFSLLGATPQQGWSSSTNTVGNDLLPGANGGTSGTQNWLGALGGAGALWSLLGPLFK